MYTIYPKRFKIEAVKKALSRNQTTPLASIALTLDGKQTTLRGWIRAMENKKLQDTFTSGGV